MDQAKAAGIDGFILAWEGPGRSSDQNLVTLLEVARQKNFWVSIYFETRFFTTQEQVVAALRYLIAERASHPAFLRHEGKPVFFFYNTATVARGNDPSPLASWGTIRRMVDPNRQTVWINEGVDIDFLSVFDGHHLYSVAWAADPVFHLRDWGNRVRSFNAANGTNKLWVATAMPGYDDTRTGRADAFAVDRANGQYYRTTFGGALTSNPDWMVINSWNEWFEGSSIEPGRTSGNLYLDLTREYAAQFKGAGTPPAPAPGPTGAADFALPNGHFFTQAVGQPGRGFAVTDDDGVRFWGEFQRLGGVAGVGYPISRRFVWDGFVSQAFQKMVFQWRADEGRVYAVNVIDLMHERGLDPWLRTVRATPGIADWSSDAGRAWPEVVAAHQALLTDPDIRATYVAVGDPVTLYGLPMAPIQDMGNVLVLRAQRGILQKWLIDVPWAAAGQVTVANSGDVAKEAGLLPAEALIPESR